MFKPFKTKLHVIESPSPRPELTDATLLSLKHLPHNDGFKFILASLRFEKAVMLDKLVQADNPDLRADVRAINRLEQKLSAWAQMEPKKSRPAISEEEAIFKKVSAATQIV